MANLTIFCQRLKFSWMNSGEGYQQGGEFDELRTYAKSDDIWPKTEIQLNKLKRRVPTEQRIQRIRRTWQICQIWRYFAKDWNSVEWTREKGTNRAGNSTNLAHRENLMIFGQRLKFSWISSGEGYQPGGEFDELRTYAKSDDIWPKTEIQLNKLKRRVPTEQRIQRIRRTWQICQIWRYFAKDWNSVEWTQEKGTNRAGNSTNLAHSANLMIFGQRLKFSWISSGEGYQPGGEFDKFGKYGKSDDIWPKTGIQLNKLKRRVST